MDIFLLIAGLGILVFAGELLVKGAVKVAYRFDLSPLVVGMTVVSFGTSAPELLVSIKAAVENHPDIAIGNVIGSNISNLALVLGITTLIFPMPVDRNSIRYDWPMMMLATVLLYLAMLNLTIEWYEGFGLVIVLIGYLTWLIWESRKNQKLIRENEVDEGVKSNLGNVWKDLAFVVIGCVGLSIGANLLLDGAVNMASSLGVSEHVIGVTIVAFGTSVPELATSCVAAFRKQTDISVGNLIGSNIFNIMAILGITSLIKEIPINEHVVNYDMFWVAGISLIVLPFMLMGAKITRVAGSILLASYIFYVYFVVTS